MTVLINSRADLTLEHFRRIAHGGEGVTIGSGAKHAMAAAARSFAKLTGAAGDAIPGGAPSAHGFAARAGDAAGKRGAKSGGDAADAGDSAGAAGAAGGGDAAGGRGAADAGGAAGAGDAAGAAGAAGGGDAAGGGGAAGGGEAAGGDGGTAVLPERVVRGIVFARLADVVEGHTACRAEAAELLAALLDGPLPPIPPGCLMPPAETAALSHVMSLLPGGRLTERERRALLLGSPCATALAADAAIVARHRLRLAVAVFALSAEALNAPLDAYHPALGAMWGDRFVASALDLLNHWLAGAPGGRRPYQAPVSYRVLPHVLGQAARAAAGIAEVARVSLSSVTVDPVYLPPSSADSPGVVLRTGGTHNATASPALDTLSAAWADLCTLADRHTANLLREDPYRPAASPGSLGFAQAGIGEQARHAAARTLLPPSEAGAVDGQDDVSAPVFFAYHKHLAAVAAVDRALAVLAIVASQELGRSGREPAAALLPLARLAGVLGAADRHRPGEGVERVAAAFSAVADGGGLPARDVDGLP